MGFTTLDWAVLAVYLAASVFVGASFVRNHKTSKDYLLAGRKMSWFPIAISIIATDLSALSYIGVPALVFKNDLKYIVTAFLMPLQMGLVTVIFVPLLYRLNIYTVYGYLERRFNANVRLFAALLFLGGRGAWLATITCATAVVLTEITGMDTTTAIIISGMSTTFYTVLGGMEAIVWTDFMQFFVLVGGALAILAFILYDYGGDVGLIWETASTTGHTVMFDFSFDPTREYTFWGLLIGTLVYQLATYGTDQINVQRYFATKDLKNTIWATLGSAVILFPVLLLLYAIGLGLVAYYHDHPELQATVGSADRVMPHFVTNIMPAGLRGLVIAGIFAATMSSMSSGINSLATSTIKDLLERFSANVEEYELLWAKLLSLGWGLATTCAAMLIVNIKLTIIEKFNAIYQFFAGPLVGIFLLGIFTRRSSSWPVVIGAVMGFAATSATARWSAIHWLWYSPIGCGVTMIVGYLGSFLVSRSKSLRTPELMS